MEFKALTVLTTPIASELVADIFFDIGGQGVAIIDGSEIAELYKGQVIWDYIDRNVLRKTNTMVTGYTSVVEFDNTIRTLNARLDELRANSDFELGSLEILIKDISSNDWQNTWKSFYAPIEFERVVVVPSWQSYVTDKAVVKINPGLAFGTGEHESTRMCLSFLEKLELKDKIVSDIGCGSGILGIAALALGAKSCYFSDIDSEALINTRENALLSGVEDKIIVERASLLSGNAPRSNVILANLTADILIRLCDELSAFLGEDTEVIVSGIILERKQDVIDAFAALGLPPKDELIMNNWAAFRF